MVHQLRQANPNLVFGMYFKCISFCQYNLVFYMGRLGQYNFVVCDILRQSYYINRFKPTEVTTFK